MKEALATPEAKITRIEVIVGQHPEVAGLQAYEYFRSHAAQQEKAFIAGELHNPNLTYEALTPENITKLALPAHEALLALLSKGKNKKTDALFNAIESRYAEIHNVAARARYQ